MIARTVVVVGVVKMTLTVNSLLRPGSRTQFAGFRLSAVFG